VGKTAAAYLRYLDAKIHSNSEKILKKDENFSATTPFLSQSPRIALIYSH
jgi:hypothetical protein